MANYLTNEDVQNYGPELISVTQRAALTAVAPHLQNLESQNAQLQQRLAVEARRRLDDQIARAVPAWQEIDKNPAWHRWLLGIDSLSGRVRQTLLNESIANGDTNRVVAFFRGFQRENPAGAQAAASTRNRSSRSSVQGRIYSRDEISKLYRRHQQGAYNGREAEWARQENDIIAAGREGRILGGVDLHGK